tara:strand:+ start:415 stop:714 length:300 start_codon:yes stop_codon:yes gene_type:complete
VFSKKYREAKELEESNARKVIQDANNKLLQDVKDEFPMDLHITYCDIIFRVHGYIITYNNGVKVRLAYNVGGDLAFRMVDIDKLRIMRDSRDNPDYGRE